MLAHEVDMQRLRLKADGRIVELRDGQEFPLADTPKAHDAVMAAGAYGKIVIVT
jgi:putative transcriptional regulator